MARNDSLKPAFQSAPGRQPKNLDFEVSGLAFEVLGLGFDVLRLGFEVMGLGFEVSGPARLEAACAGFNGF